MDLGKSRNDHKVANRGFESRGAVDRNHAGTAFAFDGVGDQTFAIVDVPNVNLLVFTNLGSFHQIFINGARAFVVQFTLGHRGAVNFGFQKGAKHELKN